MDDELENPREIDRWLKKAFGIGLHPLSAVLAFILTDAPDLLAGRVKWPDQPNSRILNELKKSLGNLQRRLAREAKSFEKLIGLQSQAGVYLKHAIEKDITEIEKTLGYLKNRKGRPVSLANVVLASWVEYIRFQKENVLPDLRQLEELTLLLGWFRKKLEKYSFYASLRSFKESNDEFVFRIRIARHRSLGAIVLKLFNLGERHVHDWPWTSYDVIFDEHEICWDPGEAGKREVHFPDGIDLA